MALTQIKLGGLAANSVDSDAYVNGSIDNAHLANDAKVGWNFLEKNTEQNVSEIDFTDVFSSSYDLYCLRVNEWISATDNVYIRLRFITGTGAVANGGTVQSGSGEYAFEGYGYSSDSTSQDSIYIFDGTSNDTPAFCSLYIVRPTDTDFNTHCYWMAAADRQGSSPQINRSGGAGVWQNTSTAVTGIRLDANTGNVSHVGSLYGLRES